MYLIPDFDKGLKIDSVGTYLGEIKRINEDRAGDSTKLFFRGQETEFWNVEPSIFRGDMLSIEHELMVNPLQKVPMEFRSMQDAFEIMTKYQHYGMCTRLLDLTTNPLVALYFACKQYGVVEYKNDGVVESMEPFGKVFFKAAYPVLSDDINVKIITALSKKDLDKENDLENILEYLVVEGVVSNEKRTFWLSDEHIDDFIKVIQNNYLVMPLYSNERLVKQSGAFLLPGLFGFVRDSELEKSIIAKCKKDLRSEFDDTYFYIEGSDKDSILEELNWYNINESTLFPELEHQLNYIKHNNSAFTRPVGSFDMYSLERREGAQELIPVFKEELLERFNNEIRNYTNDRLGDALGEAVYNILQRNMVIDWYNRESIKSKMRMEIVSQILNKVDNARELASDIVNYIVDEYIKISGEQK